MSEFDWGAIVLAGIGAVGYFVSLEVRLRNVQAKLVQSNMKVVDNGIVQKIHSESDDVLDLDLAKNLGSESAKN